MIPPAEANGTQSIDNTNAAGAVIILAGATGALGQGIVRHLRQRGAVVKALVRPDSDPQTVARLREQGVSTVEVDYTDVAALTETCSGASCVVSAVSGLRDVIVEGQTRLLDAAVKAGVPRFIPSDYSIDFTRLTKGTNRNLDLRRAFAERLDRAAIAPTSILNGMFTDLLTGQAPVVLFGLKRVVYWGNADQPLDFTTMDDTAAFTAAAALDPTTPRFLRIAGEVITIRGIREAASQATGQEFGLLRAGGLGMLHSLANVTRTLFPSRNEVFPAWQGMQYLHNMFTGLPKLNPLDNTRYPDIRWTTVREVLARR